MIIVPFKILLLNVTIFVDGDYLTFTRHEPVGVCGQIIPVSRKHNCTAPVLQRLDSLLEC